MTQDTILNLETLAANAWPAAEVVHLDGWRLRFAGGVTRRANSVWPNGHAGTLSFAEKLNAAEQFYAQRGAPATFQICDANQPPELDAVLAERGYTASAYTFVQTTAIDALLARLPALRTVPHYELEVCEEFDELWFDLYCATEQVDAHGAAMRRDILQRIGSPHGYALLRCAGEPAAVGLGVVEERWLGLYCLATLPSFRRQGAARAVLRTLAIWSQLYDAERAYLQVMTHNTGAQALYTGAGFTTAYSYHYRQKWNADEHG